VAGKEEILKERSSGGIAGRLAVPMDARSPHEATPCSGMQQFETACKSLAPVFIRGFYGLWGF
jgi:hypothetical protein